MENRINVPAWNHFPFLGYLHYKSRVTNRYIDHSMPQKIILPKSPYLGFIDHSVQIKPKVVYTKEVGTQTDTDRAMELGQQIINKCGYD